MPPQVDAAWMVTVTCSGRDDKISSLHICMYVAGFIQVAPEVLEELPDRLIIDEENVLKTCRG